MAHETVTYIIVPFKDVTKEMIDYCAETSLDTLRHTVSGEDLVTLKYIKYQKPLSPIKDIDLIPKPPSLISPTKITMEVDGKEITKLSYPKSTMEYNSNFSKYPHAFEITPKIFEKYNEYTYGEILNELEKPEWVSKATEI